MTTTEQVTTTRTDAVATYSHNGILTKTPFAINLLEEMMVFSNEGTQFPEVPFTEIAEEILTVTDYEKIADEILPTFSLDWKKAHLKLKDKLSEAGDTALKQCILEAVISRLNVYYPVGTDGSIDFLQFHMTVANNVDKKATISPQGLEVVLGNLALSQTDIPEKRILRQAEKHIDTIVGIIHPQIIKAMFPNGGYSILDNNIDLEKVTPAVVEVVTQNSADILERVSMGTEDMKANQIFPALLAAAIVEELNILKPPHTYSDSKPPVKLDENEEKEKTPNEIFSAQLGRVIHSVLSKDNPKIPRNRKVGSFNYDMPDAIVDMDRLFYLGYSHLFSPAALSKLLGVSEQEFLNNPKYNSIIEIASRNLPVMLNPYDGHRKTTDVTVFQNIVRVDREKNKDTVTEPVLLAVAA